MPCTDTHPLCHCGKPVSRDGVRNGRQRYRNECGACRYKSRNAQHLHRLKFANELLHKNALELQAVRANLANEQTNTRALLDEVFDVKNRLVEVQTKHRDLQTKYEQSARTLEREKINKKTIARRLDATLEAHADEMANKMAIIAELSDTRNRQIETIKRLTMQNTKLTVKVERLEQDVVDLEGIADGLRDALVLAETVKLAALDEADQHHQKEIDLYIKDQKILTQDGLDMTSRWMQARRKLRISLLMHGITLLAMISTLYFLAL